MSVPGLTIRHLTFLGPTRPPASLSFEVGLNVIYGASNTGKSFVLDTIDFMLGGKGPLRDIPERVGYDRILLAIQTLSDEQFTLLRSTEGGAFRVYEGLHTSEIKSEGLELAEIHSERRDDNLSSYLLSKIGLEKRRVRRNKRDDTQSLSFRNLARLVIVNEEEIIQQRSPLSDGNYTADTSNVAVFKLLLTGVDDSALVATRKAGAEEHSREGQLELLDQLIEETGRQVRDLAGPPKELETQQERLEASLATHSYQLSISEARYKETSHKRRELLRKLEDASNRLSEIASLLERFTLLEEYYLSDVQRLKGIAEAGTLFVALADVSCPLCGALPENHKHSSECDGNVDAVIKAANAEVIKIELRQAELSDTIADLEKERLSLERRIPKLERDLHAVAEDIKETVYPDLRQLRSGYSALIDKRGEVREALTLVRSLRDLEDRRNRLKLENEAGLSSSNPGSGELPTSAADKFATLVLEILKAWHFPEAERVHFDLRARDLVINGKNRTSYGKGLRAITQAAFTAALMEYCRREDTNHPGFSILDSPLLSYREPDGIGDDLRGTDVDDHFYTYLASVPNERQIIIIENTTPPTSVRLLPTSVEFTGNSGGRYGFFPAPPDLNG